MRYFSTFTGIGGFELGIQNAYREAIRRKQADTPGNDEAGEGLVATQGQGTSSPRGRASAGLANLLDERPLLVGYSEIDKYADKVFKYHFKGAKNYGDITKINAEELPDFDCLVGGFPCQAFSIAGRRGGFNDTRGTLFFDLARILKAKRPGLFAFENVKGLLSHDNGQTFRTIIATIDELGYDCQWQVLNSKNHGVPQNRERIIIVGHLRGEPRPQVFPITSPDREDTRIVGQDIAYTIDANYHKGTNTLEKSRRSVVLDKSYVRRLTPLECERLQGFPDYWTEVGCDVNLACSTCIEQFGTDEDDFVAHSCGGTKLVEMSDTQRYKMCGNAVTTNVIQAVFERIFE
jgi:DNA (cytosine-5)-methyltransferase 1